MKKLPQTPKAEKYETVTTGKWRRWSKTLEMLSCVSPYLAYQTLELVTPRGSSMYDYSWVFYLFLPISLATIIFAMIKKNKGMKYMGCLIVGMIVTILLAVFGSYMFIFPEPFDFSTITAG